MNDINDLKGGKLFTVDNEECFSIGSRSINQNEIEKISAHKELIKVLFYYINFISVDFSAFSKSNIKQFTFLHGNFSCSHLNKICEIPSIKIIQLLDTNVSEDEIKILKINYPNINFK